MDEERPVDLSVLDPRHDETRFEAIVSHVAQRALELRRSRDLVVRRGGAALLLAMAAGLASWFATPRPQRAPTSSPDLLGWATRDIDAGDVLELGGRDAR
jgi:hypothetical protein